MKVVVIEDDDITYEIIQYNLAEQGITNVSQAICGDDAMALIESIKEGVVWVVDGIFPMNKTGKPTELGPQIAWQIRDKRGEKEVIVGFSTRPEIFQAYISPSGITHNIDKGNLRQAIPQLQDIIEKVSSKREVVSA